MNAPGLTFIDSEAITTISSVLKCRDSDISGFTLLKKGMTNRSYVFSVNGQKYLIRIPGEGTERIINRKNEAAVYNTIRGLGICDDLIYIDPASGYKISRFLCDARVCDPEDISDLIKCMAKLRQLHELSLSVGHSFDIFEQISFYESLWEGTDSIYPDYLSTKERIFSLRTFIDPLDKQWCLTHIDPVCDNFLFYRFEKTDEERLQLTDWEYAGMQDPHVDIAMFCIYSLFDKYSSDRLIDIYFQNRCDMITRAKIYCYIASCGLLWSNWCEFKRKFGIEFGDYASHQYQYAKDYYVYAMDLIMTYNAFPERDPQRAHNSRDNDLGRQMK